MRIFHEVVLDHFERQALERAYVHMRIAYPDDVRYANTRDQREAEQYPRAVNHMMKGNPTRHEVARRAHTALRRLLTLCEEQSDRAYWEREFGGHDPLNSPEDAERIQSKGVGLIAPGTDVIGVLVETRQAQARDAQYALNIVNDALAFVPDDGPLSELRAD